MKNNLIYLDSYTLQQDMLIRLPKSVLANMNVEKGKTKLDIFSTRKRTLWSLYQRISRRPILKKINDIQSIRIERIWAMPNKNTFEIPPIKALL